MRFFDALCQATTQGVGTLLEVGPGNVLTAMARDGDPLPVAVPSLRDGQSETRSLLAALAERGNLIAVTDPLGAVTRFVRDARGRLVTQVDALGNVTRISTNAAGLPLRIVQSMV